MAKALLGQWEEAAKDLHVASKIDFDEEISAALKQVCIFSITLLMPSFAYLLYYYEVWLSVLCSSFMCKELAV